MAKLPSSKRIQRHDVQEAPNWIVKLLHPINNFFQAIYIALANNLTFQDNFKAKIYEIQVDGLTTNLEIPLPENLPTITGVLILSVIGDNITSTPGVVWNQVGKSLIINKFLGLDVNTAYILKILVI